MVRGRHGQPPTANPNNYSTDRQQSMKAATHNAAEMIHTLTPEVNQARQSQITEEIIEAIGGAEALRSTGRDN
jgi:F0F1-type ATP synthase gamma subunit